ncbi:hypothetical protein FHR66_002645 [Xanthomonas sp. F4]
MEYGWVDYYVYGQAFMGDVSEAKLLVEAGVHQWGTAKKPARHLAVIRS